MKNFYAVRIGRKPGLYEKWEDAKEQVDGFSGAIFEGFSTKEEARKYFIGIPEKSFKSIPINFSKASIEFVFDNFQSRNELKKMDEYVYRNSMENVLDWLSSHQDVVSKSNGNLEIHNFFSIVGDRGVGKSSFMETLSYAINNGIYKDNRKNNEADIFVLPKIDPNIFDNTVSMIEFFIVVLKSSVDSLNDNVDQFINDNRYMLIDKFNYVLRDVIEILKNIRITSSQFAEKKSGFEVLENIQEKSNFKKKINELVQIFLSIQNNHDKKKNYTMIAVLFDDLDLVKNEDIYESLQDCFKFLLYQDNIVAFISYREKQLINSVLSHLIDQNKLLLDQKKVSINELQEQASNFIEKGLPRQHRVYLLITQNTSIYSVLYPFISQEELDGIEYLKKINLNEFIHNQLMEQTRLSIKPTDGSELTKYIFPKTLRSTIQYLQMLHSMEDYSSSLTESDDFDSSIVILRKNIKKYKYFFFSLLQDNLTPEYLYVIEEFTNLDNYYKNSYTCVTLLSFIDDDALTSKHNKEVYNIFLSDVFESMYYFKEKFTDELSNYFIYSLKMLYSIEMLLAITKSMKLMHDFTNEAQENLHPNPDQYFITKIQLDKYLNLNRGKIMPDSFWYNKELSVTPSNDLSKFINWINTHSVNSDMRDYVSTYLFYSDISSSGDVRIYGEKSLDYTKRNFHFKYRKFNLKKKFEVNNHYNIDLYSVLSDEAYMIFSMYKNIYELKNHYIFYSMFDLDLFIRKNYSFQTPNSVSHTITYSIDRVNDNFIKSNLNNRNFEENKIVAPLFKGDGNTIPYSLLIPEKVKDLIKDREVSYQNYLQINVIEKQAFIINEFIDLYEEYSPEDIPVYMCKNFLRSVKEIFGIWPEHHRVDVDRLNDLIIDGNRKRINDSDLEDIDVLYNYIIHGNNNE